MSKSPFGDSKADHNPWFSRSARQPVVFVLAVSLLLGLSAVAWRAMLSATDARIRAGAEALAASAAVEAQLNEPLIAAEILGAVARHSDRLPADFQDLASHLLAVHPGLACIELQPRGIVSAIVPRSGNERVIGANIFKDPPRRLGANLAIQKRALTVAGPLRLYRGEPAIAVMTPIFRPGSDGREPLWGFVTASMRLSDALARAQVIELAAKGYHYKLLATTPVQQKMFTVAGHGKLSLDDAVQQPIRARNLEMHLALQPSAGWVNRPKVVFETAAVLFAWGLLALATGLWSKRRTLETSLATANRQLASETADREGAQEACKMAKATFLAAQSELSQSREALQQAETHLAQLKARLEETERSAAERAELAEARQKQAEGRSAELKIQLDSTIRATHQAAQARDTELEQVRAALRETQRANTELKTQLATAVRDQQESIAAAQSRAQQDQEIIADLQSRMDAALVYEDDNRALRARLVAAERAEVQVAELTAHIDAVQKELERQKAIPAQSAHVRAAEPTDPKRPFVSPDEIAVTVTEEETAAASQSDALPFDTDSSSEALPREKSSDESSTSALADQKPDRQVKRRSPRKNSSDGSDQVDLFSERTRPDPFLVKPAIDDGVGESGEAHPPASPSSLDLSELRKAIHQILPLLIDQDPGAKDCLEANQATFRLAFSAEAYAEFEPMVNTDNFAVALDHLKKAARKYGIRC